MGPNIGPKPGPRAKMRALGPWDPSFTLGEGARAHFGPGLGLGPNIWAHGPHMGSHIQGETIFQDNGIIDGILADPPEPDQKTGSELAQVGPG